MSANIVEKILPYSVAALALVCGCSSESSDPVPDPADPNFIETNLTDPDAVLAAHDRAWKESNFAAYDALLDTEFAFYPLSEDTDDFPWMNGESWDETVELGMAANMFDPGFAGGEQPVDLIEIQSTKQSTRTLDGGVIELTCSIVGRVMWSATDGKSFDTRVTFQMAPRDGFLRIRRVDEIPRIAGRSGHFSVEPSSWGSIKGLYR